MQELSLRHNYQTIHNKCTRRHHTCHNIPDTSYPVYIRLLGESVQAYIPNPAFAWKSARAAAASLGKAYNVKDIRWEMCAALKVWARFDHPTRMARMHAARRCEAQAADVARNAKLASILCTASAATPREK